MAINLLRRKHRRMEAMTGFYYYSSPMHVRLEFSALMMAKEKGRQLVKE